MRTRALLTLLALTAAAPAFADEEGEGALVEKVAVKNRLFNTNGRFELGVNVGFTLLTQLTEHYTFNLAISYDIVTTFAVELLGGYSYSRHTSLARDVASQFATNNTMMADDLSNLWEMVGNGVIGLRWQPIYGKIGGALQDILLGNPIHFQIYLWAGGGAGFFKRESVVVCNHKSGGECDEFLQDQKPGALVSLAFGLRFFLPTYGNHHTLRLEVRDFSYLDSYLVNVNRAAALNPGNPTGNGEEIQAGITNLVQIQIGYSYMF